MKTLRLLVPTLIACSAAAATAADFDADIRPILEKNCVRCHNPKGTEFEKGDTDLDLTTQATAKESKNVIVPGDAEKSKLYTTTVLPDDAKKLMPPRNKVTHELERLTKLETDLLKAWINEGAKWPAGEKLVARKKASEVGGTKTEGESQIVAEIAKRIAAVSMAKTAAEMQPYTQTIPGTDITYDMVPIPGGKFKMGSPENEPGHKRDESPVHEVQISPFWMEKCTVTWNEFELFMYPIEEKKARASKQLDAALNTLTDAVTHPTQPYVEMSFGMGKDGYPAISMTQHAANKYCEWLSAKTGHFYRLPTEAEWEYAARAGTTTAYYWGDDASKIGEYCWWDKNSDQKYQKVGKKKPNAWGLYDMLGNVIQWTLDQYDAHYYEHSPAVDPWNVATKAYPHVARGGSWDDADPTKLRVAARRFSDPSWKVQDPQLPKSVWYHTDAQFLGFRIVRPLTTPDAAALQKYWNSGVEKDIPGLDKPE